MSVIGRFRAWLHGGQGQSQLMVDVDRVWLSSTHPDGSERLLWGLADLTPERAAESLLKRMPREGTEVGLAQRLESIGIAVGALTPNATVPDGVYGIWRSTLPIVLIEPGPRPESSMPFKIAREIGHLVYGSGQDASGVPRADVFARAFERGITDVGVVGALQVPAGALVVSGDRDEEA